MTVAREDDAPAAIRCKMARLGICRALERRVIKRKHRQQSIGAGERELVCEYRNAVHAVRAQHLDDERQEAVAHDVDRHAVPPGPRHDLGECRIDAHAFEVLEKRIARYAHVLDLQAQAVATRKLAGGPGVLPVAPGLVRRVGLDQLVEQVAVGQRVVEVEEQDRTMQHAPPPRRISAALPRPPIARDPQPPGGRNSSAAAARAWARRCARG